MGKKGLESSNPFGFMIDQSSLLNRSILAADCHVLVCAPLSKREFKTSPVHWQRTYSSWGKMRRAYRNANFDPDAQVRNFSLLRRLGFHIHQAATTEDLQNCIRSEPRVLFLLAHCEAHAEILFWDKSLFIHELASLFPSNLNAVIYGSVCEASEFVRSIKQKSPNVIVSSPGEDLQVPVITGLLTATLVCSQIDLTGSIADSFLTAGAMLTIK